MSDFVFAARGTSKAEGTISSSHVCRLWGIMGQVSNGISQLNDGIEKVRK